MNRPTSVTVFGVLNMVFGVWGLLGTALAAIITLSGAFPMEDIGVPPSDLLNLWTGASLAVGAAATAVLFAAGIGLMRMRPWARIASIGYAVYCVVATGVGVVVQWVFVYRPMIEQFQDTAEPGVMIGLVASAIGTAAGLIYPLLLWYFMTRPGVVAAFRGTTQPTEPFPSMAAGGPLPVEGANPYVAPQTEAAPLPSGHHAAESIVEAFVPSKNTPALLAYYLGLLALFPCLGFPIGIGAVYFGVKGLRRVRENPAVRGGVHAWVGVVCGSLFGLFNLLLLAATVAAGIVATGR